jgi:uncharacterized protein (DUF2141 family)
MPRRPGRSGAVAALLLVASPALAQDVVVHVDNVRSANGSVLVAVCTADDFLTEHCRHNARARARAGSADVTVGGVPPGRYAIQAFHDENDNSELDRSLIGMPREGVAFSRDAPMQMGPPRFSDAAVEIGQDGGSVTLSMRYF